MRSSSVRLRAGWIGLVILFVVGCGESPQAEGDRRNVLLITVDTLRADRLGVYGYRLPTSPNVDRLAARGVRFEDCSVQWPKTWASMASLLTGAYPKTIGVRGVRQVLHSDLLLLSELLEQQGYRTGAVVANYHLGRRFGFDQGFESFVESWEEGWSREAGGESFRNAPGKVKLYTDARIVTDQGLRWLGEREEDGRPFFLWLHYMDPHGPYLPPEKYADLFEGEYAPEPTVEAALPPYQLQLDPATGRPITDLGFYRAQYDREVRYVDDELGRLFRELEAMDAGAEPTLIVLAADHGESFGEHRYYLEHGLFAYQASVRSPLIVAGDDRLPAGRAVPLPVGLIDVAPTILELAGVAAPESFEGQSLVGLMETGLAGLAPEHVFVEAGYNDPPQRAVRRGRWKLIEVQSEEDRRRMTGESFELYDVVADPWELRNLAPMRRQLVEELAAVLRDWHEGGPPPVARGEEVELDSLEPEAQEMLRSLGYVE